MYPIATLSTVTARVASTLIVQPQHQCTQLAEYAVSVSVSPVLTLDLATCPQVQENCIDLVGRIADRGPEYVSAREWMRICFELLELLKAHKKAIRRATVNTFGYIAKAIG